jgi:hypothetical protein
MGDAANATVRRSVRVQKGFQVALNARLEPREVALKTPEEEEPVDCYRSQAVKRWWTLSTRSRGELAEPNTGRRQPSISWRRQSASFASFLSAYFWQY